MVHPPDRPLVLELAIGTLVLLSGLTALQPRLPAGARDCSISRRALVAIGAVTRHASVATGTGGPLVLVPILTCLGVPVLTAIGLSQVIQLPIALLPTGGNFAFGEPDLMLGLLLAAGLSVGTLAGAQFAHKMPRAVLGHAVSGALLIIGGLILFRAARNLLF